jgi:hypothetical protein
VDDLTFSTNEKRFPRAIAKRQDGNIHEWLPGPDFRKALKSSGFRLNPQKTRMQYCDSRQEVTGLVVNEKINVRQHYYKDVRAMTRQLVTGNKPFVTFAGKKIEVSRDQLRGMLNFVYFIKSSENERIKAVESGLGQSLQKFKPMRPLCLRSGDSKVQVR